MSAALVSPVALSALLDRPAIGPAPIWHIPAPGECPTWAVACAVAWQLGGHTRCARLVRDGAVKIVRANVIRPDHAQVSARRGGRILAAIEALPGADRLPVVLVVLRELLNDAPDEAEALDRAVVEGIAHYGVQITSQHRETAAGIIEGALR